MSRRGGRRSMRQPILRSDARHHRGMYAEIEAGRKRGSAVTKVSSVKNPRKVRLRAPLRRDARRASILKTWLFD
jgi:hypothetical protein